MAVCLVYKGRGVASLSYRELVRMLKLALPKHWSVSGVDAASLRQAVTLEDTCLLVFPGGKDVPYHEDLSGAGNDHIRRFVHNGGRFLGICAGAYYGSARVVFERGFSLEVIGTRELGFFPGTAEGCVFGRGAFAYDAEKAAEAVCVQVKEREFALYYNGGCAFLEPEKYQTVEVLGRYREAETAFAAAMVMCQAGRGKALLSGVHVEYSSDKLLQRGMDPAKAHRLQLSEPLRLQLFRELLSDLLQA